MTDKYFDRAVALFETYRDYFGFSDREFPETRPQEKQVDFEIEFTALICEAKGHQLVDGVCIRCDERI